MTTDYKLLKEVFNSPEFQKRKDELVKYYNVNASAKYTLDPRDDFIFKTIRAFVEEAIK